MKKLIIACTLAAAIVPLMAAGSAGAATSPAIYPGNGGALTQVTAKTPAQIYTPFGVITDEYGTGATIPAQYGGTTNGKPNPYPGWTASASHVQLNFAVLTTSTGQQDVIEYLENAEYPWSSEGGVSYPTCMDFMVAATSTYDWMVWSGGSWIKNNGSCMSAG